MKKNLTIQGMSCGHCVRAVEEVLKPLDGVQSVRVEIGRADLELDAADEQRTMEAVRSAIREAGYESAT